MWLTSSPCDKGSGYVPRCSVIIRFGYFVTAFTPFNSNILITQSKPSWLVKEYLSKHFGNISSYKDDTIALKPNLRACVRACVCVCVCLCLRLPVCLSVCLSLSVSVYMCLSLSVCLCLSVCLRMSVCLSPYVCLSVCLS